MARVRQAVLMLAVLGAACAEAPVQDDAKSEELAQRILAERMPMSGRLLNPESALMHPYGPTVRAAPRRLPQGRATADLATLESELTEAQRRYGKKSLRVVDPTMMVGHATVEVRHANAHYYRALAIVEAHVGKTHPLYGKLSLEAGTRLVDTGASRQAKQHLMAARDVLSAPGAPSGDQPLVYFYLGKMHLALGNERRGVVHLNEALGAFAVQGRGDSDEALITHNFLVAIHEESGDRAAATPHCQAIGKVEAGRGRETPTRLYMQPPSYPNRALAQGIEGHVTLEFTIDEAGFVRDPLIRNIDGPDSFGDAVLEVAESWRYAPRFVDGRPRSARVRTRYRFRIDSY